MGHEIGERMALQVEGQLLDDEVPCALLDAFRDHMHRLVHPTRYRLGLAFQSLRELVSIVLDLKQRESGANLVEWPLLEAVEVTI